MFHQESLVQVCGLVEYRHVQILKFHNTFNYLGTININDYDINRSQEERRRNHPRKKDEPNTQTLPELIARLTVIQNKCDKC